MPQLPCEPYNVPIRRWHEVHFGITYVLAATYPVLGADKLTIEKAMQVREPSDLQFSPDGKRLALDCQEPVANKGSQRHIWVFDVETRDLRQWTYSAKSEQSPRWSPDGRTLAFLSDRDETTQIFLMPANGGEAMKLTSAKNAVETLHWSPDGKHIAFLAPDPRPTRKKRSSAIRTMPV